MIRTLGVGFFLCIWATGFGALFAQNPVAENPDIPDRGSEAVLPTPAARIKTELDATLYAGYIAYEERVSIDPTISEWNAPIWGIGGDLQLVGPRLTGNIHMSYYSSLEETEEWTSRGFLAQRNDLSLLGTELRADLGYPLEIEGDTQITPSLGLGYRYQEFARSNFQTAAPGFSDLGRVTEEYDLMFARGALLVDHAFTEKSGVEVEGHAAWIFYNRAVNSFVPGALEGDGGFIIGLSASWYWEIKPNQKFSVGVSLDHQENQGTVSSFTENDSVVGAQTFVVEWPDNEMDRFGFEAGWSVAF